MQTTLAGNLKSHGKKKYTVCCCCHCCCLSHIPLFCDPMDCSPPGSSVHGILQARILEWVAIFISRGIFLTQRLNLYILHWQADSLPLSHQGNSNILTIKEEPRKWMVNGGEGDKAATLWKVTSFLCHFIHQFSTSNCTAKLCFTIETTLTATKFCI